MIIVHQSMPLARFSRSMLIFVASIVLSIISRIDCYSSGAPSNRKVCTSLIPGHGSKQNSPPPYRLSLMFSNNDDDQSVRLNLIATRSMTFAGFIVQARDLDDSTRIIDGTFSETSNQTESKSCLSSNQNTWTHGNGEPKIRVTGRWTPLSDFTGGVIFFATVVQVKQAYWDQIRSDPIYYVGGHIVDRDSFNKYQTNPSNSGGSSSIMSGLDSNPLNELDYNQCKEKMCLALGDENNCLEGKSCQAILSASRENEENLFLIEAKPSDNSPKEIYYSMAFSDDDKMGDDFVVDCLMDSNGIVRVGLSQNKGKSNSPSSNDLAKSILTQSSAQFVDGILRCRFRLKPKFRFHNKHYDLQEKQFIFLAAGNLENDRGFKHYHDWKTRTSEPIDLASTGSIKIKNFSYLIHLHGSLMLIAWFGFVPTAMILARYFKTAWNGSLMCGVKVWFALHRFLMICSIAMMLIAQICIFYYLGEYRIGLHQILGSIAFTLALLQPVGAFFRPHPDASNRWMFNWGHWFGGNLGHIAATAAVMMASKLKLANLNDSFLYITVIWVLCHVILNLLFQFHSFCSTETKSHDIVMQDMHQRQNYGETTMVKNHSFNYFLLFIYIVLMTLLVSILIISVIYPNYVKKFL
ncbi:hypothetical protein SSS_01270 [Sarcoptes scabiei]|uniref:Putative ferric-chelate reductase 1 -like protein n=1 Tax=Sarcoptes scabiei TaxID=52283 RepID=A0A834R9L2_SARSC|nr:hypothetical protein SSS_01270 [Sarcoptes scabiei]